MTLARVSLRSLLTALTIGSLFLLSNCGGSASNSNNSADDTLTGELNGATLSIEIADAVAQPNSIAGLRLRASDLAGGAGDRSVADGEQQIEFTIVDVNAVTLSDAVAISGSNRNVSVSLNTNDTHFVATSGTLTFDEIGRELDDQVTMSFDLGFVNTDVNNPQSATLSGTLMLTVTAIDNG